MRLPANILICRGWTTRVIDCTMAASGSAQDMVDSLFNICEEATEAVQGAFRTDGVRAIILSDKLTGYLFAFPKLSGYFQSVVSVLFFRYQAGPNPHSQFAGIGRFASTPFKDEAGVGMVVII